MKEINPSTILCLEGTCANHFSYIKDHFSESSQEKYNFVVFDNLYEKGEKLLAMKYINPEFLFLQTTGLHIDKINELKNIFKTTNYIPENVIFGDDKTAMIFLSLSRELKLKGTKFYYLLDDNLTELKWYK